MPEMDGYELARRIRDPQTKVLNPRIPIIAVTAHSLAGDRELCLAAGMDDYVSKPVRPDLLDEALTRCIGTQPAERNPPELPPVVMDPPDKSQFDAEDLIERLMGNQALAKRVAGAFMDSMPQELLALSNAITNSDADALTLAAHSIKGAAANVGSKAVSDLASQLERLGRAGAMASASEVLPELNARIESLKPAIQQFCRAS
jgi:CheY-like chemotaxis protein